MGKDIVTTCPAAALVLSHVANACADAAPDSAPRDPTRDAKPSGTPHCKNAGTNGPAGSRNVRSNPAERSGASENLHLPMLGAGPRAPQARQLTRWAAHAAAADTAVLVHAAAHARNRCLDSAGSTADDASAEPLPDRLHCNSVFVDAAARTAVRSP